MASYCSNCANTGQIKRMDTDTGMWTVEVCHCVKAAPNKYLWPAMREWMEKELATAYAVPPNYFYETTSTIVADDILNAQKHIKSLRDKVRAQDARRLAAEAEARVMGTDNLAPTIIGMDFADGEARIMAYNQGPDEWDCDYDDPQPNQLKEPTMNLSTAIFLVSDEVRAVRVSYDDTNGKDYMFKTLDATIAKDDLVVIPTQTRHGYTVGKVTEVDVQPDFDSTIQYKWCAKFDKAGFDALLSQEQGILDRIAKAEQTRKRHELAASLKLDEQGLTGLTLLAAPVEPPPAPGS